MEEEWVDGWMGREGGEARETPPVPPRYSEPDPGRESDKCEGVRLGLNLEWGTLFKACVSTTQPPQCLLRSSQQGSKYRYDFLTVSIQLSSFLLFYCFLYNLVLDVVSIVMYLYFPCW